jgi:hypothetical protein
MARADMHSEHVVADRALDQRLEGGIGETRAVVAGDRRAKSSVAM